MQTTKLQIAWTKLNTFLKACASLIDSGHIIPVQELLPDLNGATEEFSEELSNVISLVARREAERNSQEEVSDVAEEVETASSDERGGADDEESPDSDSGDQTVDGEE